VKKNQKKKIQNPPSIVTFLAFFDNFFGTFWQFLATFGKKKMSLKTKKKKKKKKKKKTQKIKKHKKLTR
jgi:hypothetical protein